MVEYLDKGPKNFAEVINKDLGMYVAQIPGASAAGGLGAGLIALANARLIPGIDILLDTVGFESIIPGADLVITGEGKIDRQSLGGKAPVGIGRRALRAGVPVVAIVGNIGEGIDDIYKMGIRAVFSTSRGPVPFEEAKKNMQGRPLSDCEGFNAVFRSDMFRLN